VSQEECARLREGVPYVIVYRYNPKHLCPKLNRSTLDIGVLGYIGILKHKEHPPEVWHIPPGTSCIYVCMYVCVYIYIYIIYIFIYSLYLYILTIHLVTTKVFCFLFLLFTSELSLEMFNSH